MGLVVVINLMSGKTPSQMSDFSRMVTFLIVEKITDQIPDSNRVVTRQITGKRTTTKGSRRMETVLTGRDGKTRIPSLITTVPNIEDQMRPDSIRMDATSMGTISLDKEHSRTGETPTIPCRIRSEIT